MVTSEVDRVITAAKAADLSLITYRQLDHWDRKGWITPSVQSASGRGKRRLYAPDDVLRMAALRHFARSGWAVGDLGEQLAATNIGAARWLVAGTESRLTAVATDRDLLELLSQEERFSVFDLEPLLSQFGSAAAPEIAPPGLRRLA